jgi:SAM-dependent methyltransferase
MLPLNMNEIFNKIFRKNCWEKYHMVFKDDYSSVKKNMDIFKKKGKKQNKFINKYLEIINPSMIYDLGCGDGLSLTFTNIFDYPYCGIDIVEDQLLENKKKYKNRKYEHANILDFVKKLEEVGDKTLFIAKDVIMHWGNDDINTLMEEVKRLKAKLLLIFKRRGQWRCRKGVLVPSERDLNNKYHEYPVNYELEPMLKYNEYIVGHITTNRGFKTVILYNFTN